MKYFIVWNEGKTEGFVTNDEQLAYETRKASESNCYHEDDGTVASTAQAFIDEWGDTNCTVQEIERE